MLDRIHPSIRKAFFVFCLVFIGSITAVVLSNEYLDGVLDKERRANNSMRVWKNKIEKAKENNQIIVQYEKPYLKLVEDGVVGEENRLSWFESLQATASSRGLNTFKFSTSSQTAVKPKELNAQYKGLNIFQSKMTLDMGLSHEGDMFAVFNNLASNAKGLYSVDKCNVTSTKADPKSSEKGPDMKASCELSWHTIKSNEI